MISLKIKLNFFRIKPNYVLKRSDRYSVKNITAAVNDERDTAVMRGNN